MLLTKNKGSNWQHKTKNVKNKQLLNVTERIIVDSRLSSNNSNQEKKSIEI
jgi:hypothetical protein